MKVAIPSYRRSNELKTKSLQMLERYKVCKEDIEIFVGNYDEYLIYSNLLPDYKIIIGEVGIDKIRMFMSNYYNDNEKILYLDDDIEKIEKLEDGKLVEIDLFYKFIKEGFDICEKNNSKIWSIYPTRNAFFMKNTIHTDLKYIC